MYWRPVTLERQLQTFVDKTRDKRTPNTKLNRGDVQRNLPDISPPCHKVKTIYCFPLQGYLCQGIPVGQERQRVAGMKLQWQASRPFHTSSLLTTNQSRDGQTRERKGGTFTQWQLSQQRKPQRVRGSFISVAPREFRQPDCDYFCRLSTSPRPSLPLSASAVSVLGPSLELVLREEGAHPERSHLMGLEDHPFHSVRPTHYFWAPTCPLHFLF